MRRLSRWIRSSYQRSRFTQPEIQLPEQTLTLPNLKIHPMLPLQVAGQCLAIPHPSFCQPGFRGSLAQGLFHILQVCFLQPSRPA